MVWFEQQQVEDWYFTKAAGVGHLPGAIGHPPGPAGDGMVWRWAGSSLATQQNQQTWCVTHYTALQHSSQSCTRIFENIVEHFQWTNMKRLLNKRQTLWSLCSKVIGSRLCIMERCPSIAMRELPIGVPGGPSPRRIRSRRGIGMKMDEGFPTCDRLFAIIDLRPSAAFS